MSPVICLALALASGQPVDLRPSWRGDFAPSPQAPRPQAAEEPVSPFGDRTGQLTLRACIERPIAVQKLLAEGYVPSTVDRTDDGKLYERWSRSDGRWESGVSDPVTGFYCPLFTGPAWLFFVPADR